MSWQVLVNPIEMGRDHIWLVLPVCAVVAAVYKTIRIRHLRDLPLQILWLWLSMAAGLLALAVVLYFLVG